MQTETSAEQPGKSALEHMLARLQLGDLFEVFAQHDVTRIAQLRRLSDEQFNEWIQDEQARNKLLATLNRGKGVDDQAGREETQMSTLVAEGNLEMVVVEHSEATDPKEIQPIPDEELVNREVFLPISSLAFLLGHSAIRLREIHRECQTRNNPINKEEEKEDFLAMQVIGTEEGVTKAIKLLERAVGIARAKQRKARIMYMLTERECNLTAIRHLAAAAVYHKGTDMELSENVVNRLANSFRFPETQVIKRFFAPLAKDMDREKFTVIWPFSKALKATQGIVFTTAKRVAAMKQFPRKTVSVFGVENPSFVYPGMSREERMQALDDFKKGEADEHGNIRRLLVTTSDIARFARRNQIPYINLVVHFGFPANKEEYITQSLCTGRYGKPGLSLLLVSKLVNPQLEEYQGDIDIPEAGLGEWTKAAEELTYESTDNPITTKDAYPPPNWRDEVASKAKPVAKVHAKK